MWFELSAQLSDEIEKAENDNVLIQYYNLKAGCYQELHSCEGDILILINGMSDYADILTEYLQQNEEIIGFQRAFYELHIERCRKIIQKLSQQMGYDRNAAIEKCQKKKKYWGGNSSKSSDIGEEALVLTVKRRREMEQKNEKEGGTS